MPWQHVVVYIMPGKTRRIYTPLEKALENFPRTRSGFCQSSTGVMTRAPAVQSDEGIGKCEKKRMCACLGRGPETSSMVTTHCCAIFVGPIFQCYLCYRNLCCDFFACAVQKHGKNKCALANSCKFNTGTKWQPNRTKHHNTLKQIHQNSPE